MVEDIRAAPESHAQVFRPDRYIIIAHACAVRHITFLDIEALCRPVALRQPDADADLGFSGIPRQPLAGVDQHGARALPTRIGNDIEVLYLRHAEPAESRISRNP